MLKIYIIQKKKLSNFNQVKSNELKKTDFCLSIDVSINL